MKHSIRRAVSSPTELRAVSQRRSIGTMGSVPWRSWGALTMGQGKKGGGWACGADRRGELELWQTANNSVDEMVVELFGHDIWPWVYVPKSEQAVGVASPEYHIRWEQPLYSQLHDVRNDLIHFQVECAPYRMHNPPQDVMFAWDSADHESAPSYVTNTSGPQQVYYGAFPDRYANNPGQYWEQLINKKGATSTRLLWEAAKDRAVHRYGGMFTLPADEYNTIEGIKPLLSPYGWRKLKYGHHEQLVKMLNAGMPESMHLNKMMEPKQVIDYFGSFKPGTPEAGIRALAIEHMALCYFYKSVRPRGGILRAEMGDDLAHNFGSVTGFIDEFYEAGVTYSGDEEGAFVWLVDDRVDDIRETDRLEGRIDYRLRIIVTGPGETVTDKYDDGSFGREDELKPLMCCPLGRSAWGHDYDSREEFLARFFDVVDWEFANCETSINRRLEPPVHPVF